MGSQRNKRRAIITMGRSVVICMPTTPLLDESRWYTYGVMVRCFAERTKRLTIRFKKRGIVTAKRYAAVAVNYLTTRLGMRSSLSAIDSSAKEFMTVPLRSLQEFRGTPTTRMFPRTLTEAFNDPIEKAEWWYPPEKNYGWLEIAMWWATVIAWAGLVCYFTWG